MAVRDDPGPGTRPRVLPGRLRDRHRAWAQPSFSHHGQFFTIPPVFTRWNHQQTIAYFESGKAGRKLEEVLSIGAPDPYGGANPVMQSATVLKELQVFPQPIQRPHPQMWEPLTTERSIKWAAERGLNGYFIVEPNSRLKKNVEIFYREAEKAGWPESGSDADASSTGGTRKSAVAS